MVKKKLNFTLNWVVVTKELNFNDDQAHLSSLRVIYYSELENFNLIYLFVSFSAENDVVNQVFLSKIANEILLYWKTLKKSKDVGNLGDFFFLKTRT